MQLGSDIPAAIQRQTTSTSETRPKSFRKRSVIIRFSARSFSLDWSSAAAFASASLSACILRAVPWPEFRPARCKYREEAKCQAGTERHPVAKGATLIGFASRRPPLLHRRKRSGEEQQTESRSSPPSESHALYGAGFNFRRVLYSLRGEGAALRQSAVVRHIWDAQEAQQQLQLPHDKQRNWALHWIRGGRGWGSRCRA